MRYLKSDIEAPEPKPLLPAGCPGNCFGFVDNGLAEAPGARLNSTQMSKSWAKNATFPPLFPLAERSLWVPFRYLAGG